MSFTTKGCLNELQQLGDFRALLASREPVIVDFSATWCGPCRMLSPVLNEAAGKYREFNFIKVDIDKFPGLASEYQVTSVPFVALFKGGKIVDSFMGAVNMATLQKFLDRYK